MKTGRLSKLPSSTCQQLLLVEKLARDVEIAGNLLERECALRLLGASRKRKHADFTSTELRSMISLASRLRKLVSKWQATGRGTRTASAASTSAVQEDARK